IPAGDTSVDVKIPITDDLIDEPNETFTVGGTVSSGNATDPADGTVTITDNDATPVVTIADVTVDEGAGTVTVPVSIDVVSSVDTVVDIVTSTGTAGTADYTETTTTVTIPAGDTSVDVKIPITDDLIDEPNETFTVGGTVSSGNATDPADGTVTITDNDATPAPTATNDTVTGNTPGDDATVKLLDNDKLSDGTEITDPSTQVTIDLDPTTPGVQNTLVVPNQGTWTVDPATGILTFNPIDGCTTDPTEIIYELTETSRGLTDIATVKAGYTEVDPIATDDTSTGNTPGDDISVNVLTDDSLSDGTAITNPATQVTIDLDPTIAGIQNTIVVANQGVWTVNPATGVLIFSPDIGFTTDPTGIIYELTETSTGLSDTATVIMLLDTDSDGIPNVIDIDDDNDGILDTDEGDGILDTDNDGIPDSLDTDSDNDGVVDIIEGNDANADGIPDAIPSGVDTDSDGLDDAFDTDNGGSPVDLSDTDGDGIYDYQDIDDDNDGINTEDENPGDTNITTNDSLDTNENGIPDSLDTDTNKCGTPYNIMTPDNDGENDSFFISCIDKPEYANNTVEIFNRWGNTVYKASGYNNESVSFKGISNGRTTLVVDEKLPAGTYYYIIDLGDGSKAKAGWLYINR
ncbi:T9SS type B sorting domain-containing protein, partial [Tenacibaculum finnmarkense]|uniref:T9SS type B sorting domain-containing protein n=1 Tax=Tenacibaculum finnmarkense TaxID=2781243 RepID=UPI001E656EE1